MIDVGCGSGISTLFFSSDKGFKKFIGFDFSPKLITLAEENRKIAGLNGFNVNAVQFYVWDAKKAILPNEKLAIFMFNPFGWETMKIFISNNIKSLRQTKSVLLYANDICIEELLKFGVLKARDDYFNLSIIAFEQRSSKI